MQAATPPRILRARLSGTLLIRDGWFRGSLLSGCFFAQSLHQILQEESQYSRGE